MHEFTQWETDYYQNSSEEAILNSNNKRHETSTTENETEIALKHSEHDDEKSKQEEVSLSSTNKGGKKAKAKVKTEIAAKEIATGTKKLITGASTTKTGQKIGNKPTTTKEKESQTTIKAKRQRPRTMV